MSKVRWGVLGCARIAEEQFIPAMTGTDGEVMAVASRTAERAAGFANRLGIPKAYGSYAELLGDPDIDAVYIPLPNHLHAEWSIQAAKHRKHVLCEKPAALSASQLQQMLSACEQNGVFFMEAFMYAFHPQWSRVLAVIQSGEIGRVQLVQANFSFPVQSQNDIRVNPNTGGGSLYDVGCYCVHAIRKVMGVEPEAVHAEAVFAEDGVVDRVLVGTLRFPGGKLGHFDCSVVAGERQCVEIVGETGSLALNLPFRPDKGEPTLTVRTQDAERVETFSTCNVYQAEISHFHDCVTSEQGFTGQSEQTLGNARALGALYAKAGRRT